MSVALIKTNDRGQNCADFLREAGACCAALHARIDRVMTDNGSGYACKTFRQTCIELGLRHLRTRPHTPKTYSKAERFVQTSLRGWV